MQHLPNDIIISFLVFIVLTTEITHKEMHRAEKSKHCGEIDTLQYLCEWERVCVDDRSFWRMHCNVHTCEAWILETGYLHLHSASLTAIEQYKREGDG